MNEERYKLVNASYKMPLELRKWDASCFPRLECKLETILKYKYGKKFKKIFRSHLQPRKLEAKNLKLIFFFARSPQFLSPKPQRTTN